MNYNFTDRVRKVLAMAREEAIRLQHDYVGTDKAHAARNIPELRTRVKDLFGVDHADDGQPVLWLAVRRGMSTGDHRAGSEGGEG